MTQKMIVPLLDLRAQYEAIKDEVDEAVHRVLDRQGFVLGPEVDALERRLAEYCHVDHAIGCASGSDAILLALMAHRIGYLAPDAFTLLTSIQLLLMVVVGGLGSLHGVIFGAIFIGLLPQGIAFLRDWVPPAIGQIPGLEPGLFGLILVLFLIYEPRGLYGRWQKIRLYLAEFPLYRKATYRRQKSYLRTERLR